LKFDPAGLHMLLNIFQLSTTEIVYHPDFRSARNQSVRHVRADE
jgi:hypothetical protein